VGYGQYFPWAIPAIYSGTGGEYKDLLNETSFLTVILLAVIGYGTTALYWKYADETK
jgi:ABC-2 type transport system permease protein